jgi:predicted secreted protein
MTLKSLAQCLTAALCLAALPAFAAEQGKAGELNYNLIEFSVQARRETPNDLMQAMLFAEAAGADPAVLAARVNKTIGDAVKQAKTVSGIKVESGRYTSSANYQKGRQEGWRTRAELNLESRDFTALARLIGRLQSADLQLGQLNFTISPDLRTRIESELTQEALAAFKSRADLIRQSLNAQGLRVVTIRLDTQFPQPLRQGLRASRMMALEEQAPPPPAEGGTTEIVLNAAGTVQVQ